MVLEPAFHWARSDESVTFTTAVFCSNCDRLEIFYHPHGEPEDSWHKVATLNSDRDSFPHLRYPPFQVDVNSLGFDKFSFPWGDLRVDGYLGQRLALSRKISGDGYDHKFLARADMENLVADGADVTRVVLLVTDQYGNARPYANDPITLHLDGPADLIGDNPFSLVGGGGAVWIRVRHLPGTVHLTAKHPRLGSQVVALTLKPSTPLLI